MITSTLPRTIGAAAAATALAALALASIPQASAATSAEPTAAVVDVKAPAVPGARTAVAEAEDATTCARPRRKLWIEGQGWVVRRVHAC
jgi:hypothetical protein